MTIKYNEFTHHSYEKGLAYFRLTPDAPVGELMTNGYARNLTIAVKDQWLYIEEAWWSTLGAAEAILDGMKKDGYNASVIEEVELLIAHLKKTHLRDDLYEYIHYLNRAQEQAENAAKAYNHTYHELITFVAYVVEPRLNELAQRKAEDELAGKSDTPSAFTDDTIPRRILRPPHIDNDA